MKQCTKCKSEYEISQFRVINKKTGKIASMCKECLKLYDREYWAKIKHLKTKLKNERTKLKRLEIRKFILSFLQKSSCMDCGLSDWRVLEFDHRDRKTKKINIEDSTKYSLKVAKEEIAKCDIVCANCHNIRTIE